MKILAVETSCDDTCSAVLEDDCLISNIVSSQISFHKDFGGVVPSIARDKHKEFITPCIEKALKKAASSIKDIDILAVTYGPGLAIALEIGINKIKDLANAHNKPVIAVNHLEGHLLSSFLKNKKGQYYMKAPEFPFIGIIISGGHTEIVLVKSIGNYTLIGRTLDDAAGEAFDKVARLLKLGYPGGPIISKVAEEGDKLKYDLPRPMRYSGDFNFSFSGMKTACLNLLRKIYQEKNKGKAKQISFHTSSEYYDSKDMFFTKKEIADFAASFENAVIETILFKVINAVKKYNIKNLVLGGGVSANKNLRKAFRKSMNELGVSISMPRIDTCTDNAGMIGLVAFYKAQKQEFVKDLDSLDRNPILNF